MAKIPIFVVCLTLVVSCAHSCHIPGSVFVLVPRNIPVGYKVTKVATSNCDTNSLSFYLKDPNFAILKGGEVVAVAPVSLLTGERTFSVRAGDRNGPANQMDVHLFCSTFKGQGLLRRSKRRWRPPPTHIRENYKGSFPTPVETIVSDSSANYSVYYTMTGPGVDQDPSGVFSLDKKTSSLMMHKAVDREKNPQFALKIRVYDEQTHIETDEALEFIIMVDDENDNPPEFRGSLEFTVPEQHSGVVVGKVMATDRDDPNTEHVKIKYTLLSESNLFSIDPTTGVISTLTKTLDREVKDKHTMIVQINDLNGKPGSLSSTATATVTLSDINDNPPTFRKTSYDATIKENEKEKLLLEIPLDDKDLENTPNWKSKLVITKGNEGGNFRVETDPKNNVGRLYIVKPLDYETSKSVQLELSAQNEAPLNGTTAQWQTVPITVSVTDEDEGPEFSAPTIRFPLKENAPNGTVIGRYTAVDPETKSSSGIRYYKVLDPASWVNVDTNTGELKVANTIDRESHFVYGGLYNISMRAVDSSLKTGTGTVILDIEDVNDNMPLIPPELVICEQPNQKLGSVVIVAEDKDQQPFSYPFTFALPTDHNGKWAVKKLNDTAAVLEQVEELPRGIYQVPVIFRDQQGFGSTQTAKVTICSCAEGVCKANQSSVALGPLGILALLLPLFLLLLLFLLLAFFCTTRTDKVPFNDAGYSGGILLTSNTEAPGDEVDSIVIPSMGGEQQQVKDSGKLFESGWVGNKSGSTLGGHSLHDHTFQHSGVFTTQIQQGSSGHFDYQQHLGNGMGQDFRQFGHDSSYLHNWQTNGLYLQGKLTSMVTVDDGRFADDIVHSYGYEGAGSTAGSVGCCSEIGDNDTLDFLNTLGPKFKTLGEVCRKT